MNHNFSEITKYVPNFQNLKPPKNIDPQTAIDAVFKYYSQYSYVIAVVLYLFTAKPQSGASVHFIPFGFLLFAWQHNLKPLATAANTPFRKLTYIVPLFSAHLLILNMMWFNPWVGHLTSFFVLGLIGWFPKPLVIPPDRYIKGAKVTDPKVIVRDRQKKLEIEYAKTGKRPELINLLGIPITMMQAVLGFIFFGESRTGKSLVMSILFFVLKNPIINAIMYDYGGNYLGKLLALGIPLERIIILNPFHRDCHEPLLSEFLTNPSVIRAFFGQMMPTKDPKEDFFNKGAINIATDVAMTLNRLADDAGKAAIWGFKELCVILTSKSYIEAILKIYPDIWQKHEGTFTGSEQTQAYLGVLQNAFQQLQVIGECYYRARKLGRTINLKTFCESNYILLLGRDEREDKEALDYMNGGIIDYCIRYKFPKVATDVSKSTETIIVADECQNLGKIPGFMKAATEGGKCGVSLVLATQSFEKLKAIYGIADTSAMLGSIRHTVSFRVTDTESATHLSKYFGDTTIARSVIGETVAREKSRSVTVSQVTEPLFTPGHFKSLTKVDDSGLMGVTVKVGSEIFVAEYPIQDILDMTPPKPNQHQESMCYAPQDESLYFPQPLTDDELYKLGLEALIENDENEDSSESAFDDDEDINWNIGDDLYFAEFGDDGEDQRQPINLN